MMNRKPTAKRSGLHARGKRRLIPTAALVAAAVVLAFAGIAVARYVLQYQQDGLATAKDFYFTSDYLKESSENASYFIDPKTTSFSIKLSNSADAQRVTEGSIAYSVKASGATVTDSGSGTLPGSNRNDATLTVVPMEDSFSVTVTSTSPYEKVLTATFERVSGDRYRVEDAAGNTAAVLTVTCTDGGTPVSLKLPSGVVPDATDSRVVASVDGSYAFTPAAPGAYSVVLLKSDKATSLAKEDTSFTDEIEVSVSHG